MLQFRGRGEMSKLRGMSVGPDDGHAHGSGNPHYWLDPENAEIITATLLEALARIDPDHASDYEARRTAFVARLRERLGTWQAALARLKGLPIVAYHNSWPYFARRFRLDLLDFIETKPGVPPSPAHLAALIETMRSRGAHLVIREPYDPERDVTFVAISRAPLAEIERFRQRMGWQFKWVSSHGSDFNYDFGVSFTPEQVAKGEIHYNYDSWAVAEWECVLKHPDDGAREAAAFITKHLIRITEKSFDDFAAGTRDKVKIRKMLGL